MDEFDVTSMEKADGKRPRAVDVSVSEKLNASARRMANSAKKRALNTSVLSNHQTLKANNVALARGVAKAKEEAKECRNQLMALQAENQELRSQLASFNNMALYDEAIREEVKTRVLEIMSEIEEEFGDARTHFLQCQASMNRLLHEFEEVSGTFHQWERPMARLSKVVQKYTDDAGELLSELLAEPQEGRKTLLPRKTVHKLGAVNPQALPNNQDRGVTETGTTDEAKREAASVDNENRKTMVLPRKTAQHLEPQLLIKANGTEPGESAEIVAVDTPPDEEDTQITARKSIAIPSIGDQHSHVNETAEGEQEERDKQTVVAKGLLVTVEENAPEEAAVGGPSPVDSAVPTADSKPKDAPKKGKATSRRKTKAVCFKEATENDEVKAKGNENRKPKTRHTTFVARRRSPSPKKHQDEDSSGTASGGNSKEAATSKSDNVPQKKKPKEKPHKSTVTHDEDDFAEQGSRPKRHTQPVSYKEPPLNKKLRRVAK